MWIADGIGAMPYQAAAGLGGQSPPFWDDHHHEIADTHDKRYVHREEWRTRRIGTVSHWIGRHQHSAMDRGDEGRAGWLDV